MKKMTILIIVLMICSVGILTGCNEKEKSTDSGNNNPFVGTWKGPSNLTMIFFDNGTYTSNQWYFSGNWTTTENKLIFNYKDNNQLPNTITFHYSFTNSTVVSLAQQNVGDTFQLNKQ